MSVTRGLGRAKRNSRGSPYNHVQCRMPTCRAWGAARDMFIRPGTKKVLICADCASRMGETDGPQEQA